MLKNKTILKIQNLSKSFLIRKGRDNNLLGRFLDFFGYQTKKRKNIINNVSFNLLAGENLGIIGPNGSGKSTLLRLIAGIYQKDSGQISVDGKVLYISGFGLGLKPKLSVLKNIELAGILIGLNNFQIKEKIDKIINYAGLNEFRQTPVFQLSSGMLNRLRFSITIFFFDYQKPDILLLDEVFGSGGDLEFKNKAISSMEKLISGGLTVILVSHDLNLIENYCTQAILLTNGKMIKQGEAKKIVEYYKNLST